MISGGYIYFYKSGQDEEYSGYFYLKDTVLNPNKDNLSIQLQNDSGIEKCNDYSCYFGEYKNGKKNGIGEYF